MVEPTKLPREPSEYTLYGTSTVHAKSIQSMQKSEQEHTQERQQEPEGVYIKYLPKDKLLYELWKPARRSQYLYYCPKSVPQLTLEKAKRDINHMIENSRDLDITTYYGKLLFIDISGDYMDPFTYNLYNGRGTAEEIIKKIKIEEMNRSVLKFYTFN